MSANEKVILVRNIRKEMEAQLVDLRTQSDYLKGQVYSFENVLEGMHKKIEKINQRTYFILKMLKDYEDGAVREADQELKEMAKEHGGV